MGILDGRVVLITDTGTYAGYYLALAINEAGARVIVNDETGGGTVRAAADALAKTIKRRGGKPALPAYGNFSSMRKCIEMVRAGPDKWDWLSGIVHIGPGADDLRLLIRAAQPEMSKWGGMIVTVDADAATAAVVTEQASVLAEHRITINAVRAGEADHTSMVCYLLAPISSSVTGQVINAEPDHSSKEIAANIVALLAAQAAPAAPAPHRTWIGHPRPPSPAAPAR